MSLSLLAQSSMPGKAAQLCSLLLHLLILSSQSDSEAASFRVSLNSTHLVVAMLDSTSWSAYVSSGLPTGPS